jgi:hypothetical protein
MPRGECIAVTACGDRSGRSWLGPMPHVQTRSGRRPPVSLVHGALLIVPPGRRSASRHWNANSPGRRAWAGRSQAIEAIQAGGVTVS